MKPALTRRNLLRAGSLCFGIDLRAAPLATRSFWVLKLLRPASLIVRPLGAERLHCTSPQTNWILEGSESLSITPALGPIRITGPSDEPVNCVLEIPNLIRRHYFGQFNITCDSGTLIPVVTMDCEVATGSVVQAELPAYAAPVAALAAQAVVARSVICAPTTARHSYADFCDTTHCQFLRDPAKPDSNVADAVRVTRGIVLCIRNDVLPARYSAACGGSTESGFDGNFEYLSVPCDICRGNRTTRRGHGWGLCQEGAMGLARLGWTWRAIVAKYYPNASISCQPSRPFAA